MRNVKAIIIGPPDTPYEFGFFEVGGAIQDTLQIITNHPLVCGQVWKGYYHSWKLSDLRLRQTNLDYPGKAPSVHATTTNGGRCRFNPNIYAGGKVCL